MNSVIFVPDLLDTLIDIYFSMTKAEEKTPTVAGLALAAGFDSTRQLQSFLDKNTTDGSPTPKDSTPVKSIKLMSRALTYIEDHYVTNGMEDKFPAVMVKYTLAVYHNLKDKEPAQPIHQTNNTQYLISFEAPEEYKGMLPRSSTIVNGRPEQINTKSDLPTNVLVDYDNNAMVVDI